MSAPAPQVIDKRTAQLPEYRKAWWTDLPDETDNERTDDSPAVDRPPAVHLPLSSPSSIGPPKDTSARLKQAAAGTAGSCSNMSRTDIAAINAGLDADLEAFCSERVNNCRPPVAHDGAVEELVQRPLQPNGGAPKPETHDAVEAFLTKVSQPNGGASEDAVRTLLRTRSQPDSSGALETQSLASDAAFVEKRSRPNGGASETKNKHSASAGHQFEMLALDSNSSSSLEARINAWSPTVVAAAEHSSKQQRALLAKQEIISRRLEDLRSPLSTRKWDTRLDRMVVQLAELRDITAEIVAFCDGITSRKSNRGGENSSDAANSEQIALTRQCETIEASDGKDSSAQSQLWREFYALQGLNEHGMAPWPSHHPVFWEGAGLAGYESAFSASNVKKGG
ncbi:hypothetical protein Q5752_004263 [Cryptotrichosporon argae]